MQSQTQSGYRLIRRSRFGLLSKALCAGLALTVSGLQIRADDAAPKAEVKPAAGDVQPKSGIVWIEDFEAAKAQAVKEKKDLLMDFTGSDWCVWCVKLRKEVFDPAEFKDAAKDFVFVELDYPNAKKQDEKIKAQNNKLKDTFAIRGFPSIFLADAEGRPYAQTGYKEGGPAIYLKHLASLQTIKAKRDEAWSKAEKAEGMDKAKLLAAGIMAMSDELVTVHYAPVIATIAKLDPKDETGVAAYAGYKKELEDFFGKFTRGDKNTTVADVRTAADKFIAEHPKATVQQKQETLFGVLEFCVRGKDDEFVKKLLGEVGAMDARTDAGTMANTILKNMQEREAKDKEAKEAKTKAVPDEKK